MIKDYFSDYIKGQAYTYGLKCASPEFDEDVREVVHVSKGEEKKIKITQSTHSRIFLQVHVAEGAKVEVEVVLIGNANCVADSFIEILHEGNRGISALTVRGYTEGHGRIISRVRTHVPHEVFNVHAMQIISLYQFGTEGVIDCIPVLEIENKTTISSHAVRLEKITESEYWHAGRNGMTIDMYQNLKKESLRK